jgi:ketosteroid isomerase-like protein
MSEANVELVRRMYESFLSGDAKAALSCFTEDVLVDATRRLDGKVGRGHEYLNRMVAEWVGTFDDYSEEIEELRDLGSRVLVLLTQRGRGRGSGVEVEIHPAVLYEIKNDLISGVVPYTDRAQALEDAGLAQ